MRGALHARKARKGSWAASQRVRTTPQACAANTYLDTTDIQGGVRVSKAEAAADEILLHLARGRGDLDDAGLELRDGGHVTRQHAEHAIRAGDDHLQAS